jgi:aminopeptidase-like protein
MIFLICTGNEMYTTAERLFPLSRSITGDGTRLTLKILQELLPELKIYGIPSGTRCFDWIVPLEWNITDAYILDASGKKIVDFKQNNLHVMGYSIPIDAIVDYTELNKHLYSLPCQPDAIPYVTSYYSPQWGFCITQHQRDSLRDGKYKVVIKSTLAEGILNYGEIVIPGQSEKEILLSTYICHPSLANDNISGIIMTTYLAKWILHQPRRYTYRILFIPETIGAIVYLSKHHEQMKEKVIAGFVITCCADNGDFSFMPSKGGQSLADNVARHVLKWNTKEFREYSFLERGSDERQYCSPGIDLPVVSIMRSMYRMYPEYHTSLDNLSFISAEAFRESFSIYCKCLNAIEKNNKYRVNCLCEPQLGKRGLFSQISMKNNYLGDSRDLLNVFMYCDGTLDLIEIANQTNLPIERVIKIADILTKAELISVNHY